MPVAPTASSSFRISSPVNCSERSTCPRTAFPFARTARRSGTALPLPSMASGYLLFVGTIEPRKNVAALLDAYARVRTRNADVPPLVIAGGIDADDRGVLAPIDRPPLAGHVEYRGYVPTEEREALFKGAQAFVLPSFEEGFGIPALEAMSAGVPVDRFEPRGAAGGCRRRGPLHRP